MIRIDYSNTENTKKNENCCGVKSCHAFAKSPWGGTAASTVALERLLFLNYCTAYRY